jgi:cell wall assembly regulator SMI1
MENRTMIESLWKRIHDWLDANAPAGYGDLRPGATENAISAAEQAMGIKLPDDMKGSYRIHDGQGNEPGLIGGEGWCLLRLGEMVEIWRRWCQFNPENARRVPVAWGGTNDYVFLDLRPEVGESGCMMVQRSDSTDADPLAPSYSAWLVDYVDRLEAGEFAYCEDEGCIMHEDEIDLD